MAKIFDVNSDVHESPNRNSFDLQHKRHMTGKAGVIYPFFCQPVVPTDSFEIDTAIGANLMPMWYPTQSNMRFIVHYFYVPYRIMHNGWKNQLEGLETEDFPYIDQSATFYKTGSLSDYLGIPTNYIVPEDMSMYFSAHRLGVGFSSYAFVGNRTLLGFSTPEPERGIDEATVIPNGVCLVSFAPLAPISLDNSTIVLPFSYTYDGALVGSSIEICIFEGKDVYDKTYGTFHYQDLGHGFSAVSFMSGPVYRDVSGPGDFTQHNVDGGSFYSVDAEKWNAAISKCEIPILLVTVRFFDHSVGQDYITISQIADMTDFVVPKFTNHVAQIKYTVPEGSILEMSDYSLVCPYYSRNNTNDTVKISAYPFRAYEMIYNSYYRNSQGVQPLMNGDTPVYNEYLINKEGGSDHIPYALHSRNWELDAYTSCLPSPQQGEAPIISVDSLGRMRIEDEDGTTSTLELRDLDGEQGVEVRNADIANPEHARLAMRVATSGLTIADFRQGNALQRFLEQSLRSGYRYADFIFGHFGKSPSHQELDMPQFLGGYTQLIDVSKISNVSASGDAPLGEFAGVGASFGGAKHKIKHYFDDFGLVVGVMMLVPDAAYSQVLPKHFTYQSRLDFYFPEFAQLGMQPITYEELCPIQSHLEHISDSTKLLTDTFGYQRPNHEYVWYPDSLHGLFRTNLNGSVINRRFGSRPELGDDFLKIHPEEVNDIFSVTEANDDIFIAQVVVDIKATRPIPRVVVPSLGR